MSGQARNAAVALNALSGDKAKLLERLLQKRSGTSHALKALPRSGNELPVSWAQERLWFIDQLEGAGSAYNEILLLRLDGSLDLQRLQKALDAIVMRHEVLRSVFVSAEGRPRQRIAPGATFALSTVDLRGYPREERGEALEKQTSEEIELGFDLSTGPLLRGRLLRLEDDRHVLVITMHHIVSDGWSNGVLIRELSELYSANLGGREPDLKPLPVQYADYAQWQRQWLEGAPAKKQLSYWCARLQAAAPQLDLPADRPRPAVFQYRGDTLPVVIDAHLATLLRDFGQRHGLTLFMVLYAAWAILLSRLSGQRDIVIGTPVANRRRIELESLIGFFVNTLALRIEVADRMELAEFLRRVKASTLEAYDNQDIPFERVVEAVRPPRSLSRHPIFQVAFALQSAPQSDWNLSGLKVVREAAANKSAKFDLVLSLEEHGAQIRGGLNYDTHLFDQRTVERWMECYAALLESMTADVAASLGELNILPSRERGLVINAFNATEAAFPRRKLTHQIFEGQVQRAPDAVAVIYEGATLSYAQLNARANQLAHYLEQQGSRPGEYVPIIMPRSLQMLIAQLAVLKIGAAYVPMDPLMPKERQTLIVRDCGARRIITDQDLHPDLSSDSVQVIHCAELEDALVLCSTRNPARELPEHLPAYVMYTSGSTGVPKGVIVPHSAVNRLAINNGYAQIEPTDCIVHYSNPAFDASTFEIWGALLSGARILIVPQQVVLEPRRFAEVLSANRVTILWMTIGLFAQYSEVLSTAFAGLRYLIVGGDIVDPEVVRRVMRSAPPRHLLNAYGPTECTTFTTTYAIPSLDENVTSLPIGRPISNAQVYILDARLQPVPIGVTGDLYIGGDGVALGYLNRPQLTAERFTTDPFTPGGAARLYKSGDLARWRSDGTIDFQGRSDQQVKLRGFRIELGEIEAQLARHSGVKETVVIVREDVPGDKRLVGYVVPHDPKEMPSAELLRAHIKAALPDYMVPSALVTLEVMPLTQNGKIDRRALPSPDLDAYVRRQYEAPRDEHEEILAGAWQALLQLERVGRQDNFFELGGHSLLIVQMIELLRQRGLSADVRSIYESPTLGDLAQTLARGTASEPDIAPNLIPTPCDQITPRMLTLVDLDEQQIATIVRSVPGGASNIQDIYPLAPLQEGILFHHLLDSGRGDTYILPKVFRVVSRQRVDELIAALQAVIDRHDIMRNAILWEQLPRPVQVVCRRAKLQVKQVELDAHRDPWEQAREWVRPERQNLDLRQAPLLRLQIAPAPSGEWLVLLQLHHIIIDHVAIETLTADIVAHLEGRVLRLPESAPYRNHVARVLEHTRVRNSDEFFRGKLGDIDEPTAPFGLLDVHRDGTQIEDAYQEIEPVLAQRLRAQARRMGVSAATIFHAGWAVVLARTTGRDDVVFGSVLLGRLQSSADMQHTLGMFINTLPLRLRLCGATAKELLSHTQGELMELLGHEHASLSAAQRCSGIPGVTPLFSTLLNFRHSVPNAQAQWARASGMQVIASLERTNYPITLSVDDLNEGFRLKAQTDRHIDPRRVTSYLHTALESLVQALEQAPETPALQLSILPEDERRLIESFNFKYAPESRDVLVHELFEQQVQRTPDVVAITHDGRSLSYRELNAEADRLSRHLRARGVVGNDLVAVCLERSPEMAVAVLGVLKAGGAYVPIDPSYPQERIQYMLSDAAPKLIITQTHLQQSLGAAVSDVVNLSERPHAAASADEDDLETIAQESSAQSRVYVIYTSGSTGQPKGTAMPHRGMVNLLGWHRDTFGCEAGLRVLQFAALSFDVAFQEIFTTLCTGGTLVLLDEWVRRDARALAELLRAQSIQRLFVPPLMLQSLAEHFKFTGAPKPSLRDVIVAGEQLRVSPEIIELFTELEGCRLHNHYGPTETHVVTALTLSGDPARWPALPSIGRPIANTQIHIIDGQQQVVPIGVPGEIYIAGANVALGYLHRPDLTANRFVLDPFGADGAATMYKTGDVGRWRPDGTIEYLGRNDDQVKIRGYRIELGEIEAQLARHASVREAAVVAREDEPGAKRLIAYVTERNHGLSVDELRTYLKDALPEYMVPAAFVVLEQLPLTPSGKLDRRSLPAPDAGAFATSDYQAPEGEVEQTIARIWQDVLQLDRVGRQDDFFQLGGHSLLVLKALTRINQALNAELRVKDLYKAPSLSDLAARIFGTVFEDEPIDLAKESSLNENIRPVAARAPLPEETILITGATGFVGRFLLSQLLRDSEAMIYCVIRAPAQQLAQARLREALLKWGLWQEALQSRLVAIPGDLRLPRLGLDERTFRLLSERVTDIYHCATSMNHLETYAMAKPANVDSARELLELATQGRSKLINYISTMGIFTAAPAAVKRVVTEDTALDGESYTSSQGYLASKWVSDKIFMMAQSRGVPCNIFRLGLVWADSQQGRFDEAQNVHRALKSCLLSGYAIENFRYPMPPTPVDYVALAIANLARRYPEGQGIFHISASEQGIDGVYERCAELTGQTLTYLSEYRWIREMKRLHEEGMSVPALPMIDFAFGMDEDAFDRLQRRKRSVQHVHFNVERTHRLLEQAGIVAPVLNDELLGVCLENMLATDPELRMPTGGKSLRRA